MFYHFDAFIALLGGLETLQELFQKASWTMLNIHNKPIVLLNINGFYDSLLTFLDIVVKKTFISREARKIIVLTLKIEDLVDKL